MEIERKFLATSSFIHTTEPNRIVQIKRHIIKQVYLLDKPWTVRIRMSDDDAYLTIKGKTVGISREEYEWKIPSWIGWFFVQRSTRLIEKTRYLVPWRGKTWEVDVFHGKNDGLIMAEIELESEKESFELPPFCKTEVSTDHRYFNSSLVKNPYSEWK